MAEGIPTLRRISGRLTELLVVFLGVALAFLAEDYREHLGDRELERQALAGLAADFNANSLALSERLDTQRRTQRSLALFGEVLREAPGDALVEIPDTLLMALAYTGTYDPARGTIDALLSSGDIRIIRNPDLRVALASWPSELADALEKQEWQGDFVEANVHPFLIKSSIAVERSAAYQPQWVRRDLPPEAEVWTTSVPNTSELRNVVAYRQLFADLAMTWYDRLSESEEVVRGLLSQR